MTEFDQIRARVDSLNNVLLELRSKQDSLKSVINLKDTVILNLNNQISSSRQATRDATQLITNLKDTISQQRLTINKLNREVASLDMVRLRYANGRLQLPYDKTKIKEAIELFNGIKDPNLKEECGEILTWLNKYDYYLGTVKSLMISLQNDPNRENKFQFEDWKTTALNEINSNIYNRESQGHQFSIIYLDEIISVAKDRIKKSGSKPSVDFSDLIERLQL